MVKQSQGREGKDKCCSNTEWLNPEKIDNNNVSQYLMFLRHQKAYEFALNYCQNKNVLEIGSGAGYGTKLLSKVSKNVIALDNDLEAIRYAKRHNPYSNIKHVHGNPLNGLEFRKQTFDTVVMFQVIEHIEPYKLKSFLEEIKRVISHDGKLLVTTPNKGLRLLPLQKPWNKYHKKEYNSTELRKVLEKTFAKVQILSLIAKEAIIQIEINRAKQSPLKVYLTQPIVNATKLLLPNGFCHYLKKHISYSKDRNINQPKEVKNEQHLSKYTTQDFRFVEQIKRTALDFLAICHIYQ